MKNKAIDNTRELFGKKALMYFVTAVDSKGISLAARRLSVSQSLISQSIKRLELLLGSDLINHRSKTFEITPNGKDLYRLSQQVNSITMEFMASTRKNKKTITIGVDSSFDVTMVDGFVTYLKSVRNDLEISIQTLKINELLESVQSGQIDLMLAYLPNVGSLPNNLNMTFVKTDLFSAIYHGKIVQEQDMIRIFEDNTTAWVGYSTDSTQAQEIRQWSIKNDLVLPAFKYRFDTASQIVNFSKKHGFNALIPMDYILKHFEYGEDVKPINPVLGIPLVVGNSSLAKENEKFVSLELVKYLKEYES